MNWIIIFLVIYYVNSKVSSRAFYL